MFDRKQFAHVFDVKPFDRLEVALRETNLVIRQGERASIIYYGDQRDADHFELKQEGQNLKITEKKSRNFLRKTLMSRFATGHQRIEVILPQMSLMKLTAEISDGDVAIDGVKMDDLQLKMGNGDLTVADVQIINFDLKNRDGDLVIKKATVKKGNWETQTGDIVLDNLTVQERFTANFAEGSLRMRDVIFKNAQIILGEGDVRVNGFQTTGDFNLSTNIGDLSLHDITAPTITIAAIRGNDLQNPAIVQGFPQHEPGKVGASFLTSAGHLDVSKKIHVAGK